MRSALGELDPNTLIANQRSPRACVPRAGEEMPARARDVGAESADSTGNTAAFTSFVAREMTVSTAESSLS